MNSVSSLMSLRNRLKENTIPFTEALREPKVFTMITKNEMMTSRYFSKNIQALIETILFSDEPDLVLQAYKIFHKNNSGIISSASSSHVLMNLGSTILSDLNPDTRALEQFTEIVHRCLCEFPESVKSTLSFLPNFLPFVSNYLVLDMFQDLLGKPDLITLHCWLAHESHFVKRCTDLIDEYRAAGDGVPDQNDVVAGLFQILSFCIQNTFFSSSFEDPSIYSTITTFTSSNVSLASQWNLISLLSLKLPSAIQLFMGLIPEAFEVLEPFSSKAKVLGPIQPFQISAVSFLAHVLKTQPDIFGNPDFGTKFAICLKTIIRKFPSHTIALAAVNEAILNGLSQNFTRNIFGTVLFPVLTEVISQVKNAGKNPVQFAFCVDAARQIMQLCDDDLLLLAEVENREDFVEVCNSVVFERYAVIHRSYGSVAGKAVHFPTGPANFHLSNSPVVLST